MDKLREMERSGEMRTRQGNFQVVMAKLTHVESLRQSFEGCHGVFHTSAFTDPAGLSGYTVSLSIYLSVCVFHLLTPTHHQQ